LIKNAAIQCLFTPASGNSSSRALNTLTQRIRAHCPSATWIVQNTYPAIFPCMLVLPSFCVNTKKNNHLTHSNGHPDRFIPASLISIKTAHQSPISCADLKEELYQASKTEVI
jgi:hypothetical protein